MVPVAWNWNAIVPRLEMATTLRKLDTKVTLVTVVPSLAVLLKQVTLKASKMPEDSVISIALMASMASMVASMASMASMEAKEAPMASLASVTPMARMALASLDLVASMVWVTDLNRRILCNVMLKFPPLETWICSLTKQAWDAEGSRSSRRVNVVKVKKELMGSMTLMGAPLASLASVAPTTFMALASVALVASRMWVSDLSRRKLSNEMLRFSPMEKWLGSSTKQNWVDC